MILFKRFLFIISLLQEMSPVQVRYAGAERERIGKDCSFMLLRKPKVTILRQNDWPTIMGTFQKQKQKNHVLVFWFLMPSTVLFFFSHLCILFPSWVQVFQQCKFLISYMLDALTNKQQKRTSMRYGWSVLLRLLIFVLWYVLPGFIWCEQSVLFSGIL